MFYPVQARGCGGYANQKRDVKQFGIMPLDHAVRCPKKGKIMEPSMVPDL